MRTQEMVVAMAVRVLRLTAFSAALALIAGAGAHVYAEAPAQVAAQPAATASSSAPAAAESNPPAPAVADTAQPGPALDQHPPAAATVSAAPALSPAVAKGGKAKKAKKVKKKKEKPPKLTPLHISEGTLTVDGWTGKARLNYDVADLKYIYVWAPGIGTAVISNVKFPTAQEQKNAFARTSLTVTAGGHSIQISSDVPLMKSKKPASAWVYLDTNYNRRSGYPEMGFGPGKDAPYAWPGAKQVGIEAGTANAPPLPAGLRAVLAKPVCTTPASNTGAAAPLTPVACTPAAKPQATPLSPVPGNTSAPAMVEAAAPVAAGAASPGVK